MKSDISESTIDGETVMEWSCVVDLDYTEKDEGSYIRYTFNDADILIEIKNKTDKKIEILVFQVIVGDCCFDNININIDFSKNPSKQEVEEAIKNANPYRNVEPYGTERIDINLSCKAYNPYAVYHTYGDCTTVDYTDVIMFWRFSGEEEVHGESMSIQ